MKPSAIPAPPRENLLAIARRHCLSVRPAICLKPFIKDTYGVRYEFVRDITRGRRRPSPRLLDAVRATHARLFPTEPLPTPESLGLKSPIASSTLN